MSIAPHYNKDKFVINQCLWNEGVKRFFYIVEFRVYKSSFKEVLSVSEKLKLVKYLLGGDVYIS